MSEGKDPVRIGELIRRARIRVKLTQAGLADAANITPETVSRIERNAFEPALSTLLSVARALGVNVSTLTDGDESESSMKPLSSPTVRRLAARVDRLDPSVQELLLRLSELLPENKKITRAREKGIAPGRPRKSLKPTSASR